MDERQHADRSPSEASLFSGGGELGARMRAFDWAKTPLGPPAHWPQALKTCVRIMLTSRQPIWLGWGPELTYLYNDPYQTIIGGKHPEALGQPTAVVWREIWDVIGPMLDSVMTGDEGTYVEGQLLIMARHGYEEETYYTFSYSPVPNDQGGVGGVICANTDETQRVIGERQIALLRDLAAGTADARTVEDACRLSALALATNPRDLPFAAIYLVDSGSRREARLAATVRLQSPHPAAPESVSLDAAGTWPFAEVARSHQAQLVEIDPSLGALPTGAWPRPPVRAAVLPIVRSGEAGRGGFLVVGLNPFRLFDESYRGFLNLVSGQISASISNAEAYEEEKRRAEKLAELDRAKTAFFSNVSHEFRTPLTLMLGPLEELLREADAAPPAELRGELELVHRNAQRLLRLVNTLLDFSRIEAGRVQALYEPTDLSTYTAELASTFRSAVERAGLRLQVDAPPLPGPVHVDREMWEKIVLNLLSNAFKFTMHGEIAVSLRAMDGMVELAVRDTGAGIPEDELPHVFERFHRARGTLGRTHEGSGIGLALVQELARLHGGSVTVESASGVGSTFRVRIPTGTSHLPRERLGSGRETAPAATRATPYVEEALRWLPDAEAEEPGGPAIAAGETPGVPLPPESHRNARILLADDNADMREYVARLLRQQRYRVESVADGADALEAARRERPELVLSDVMMPRLDGFELLKALREDPATRGVPILLLSARAGEESRVEGLEAGADDYLVKPFSARELLARVSAHLELARVRREASEALRESEERFRNMADHAPVMMWVTDPTGYCTYLNKRWYDFTGQTPATGLGFGWIDATHPDDQRLARDTFVSANARHEYFRMEYRLRSAAGEYRWAIDAAAPRFGPAGEFLGYVGSVIDIQERRAMEEERERLLVQAESARADAEEANRAKAAFLATMSHELRTPLNAIIGYSDLLDAEIAGPLTEGQKSQLDRIEMGARHLLQIIEEILTFSRIEAGREEVLAARTDLANLVRETAVLVEPLARGKALGFSWHAPQHLEIETDPGKVRQILLNLLSNAVKFTDHGEVRLELEREGEGAARFTVRDTGIGIPPEHRSRIFEPFSQVDQTPSRRVGGTGLGLTVTAQLVQLLGGEISVESTPGHGSRFSVRLPARLPDATRDPEPPAAR